MKKTFPEVIMKRMEKRYSQIVGMPIVVEDSPRPLGLVHDLVIDPENGNLVAFSVDAAGRRVLVPRDVRQFKRYLLIHDADDICSADEILRISEIKKLGAKILKNRVETERGTYLGRVYDYSIDAGKLKKLFVARNFLGILRIDEKIISMKYIIQITPEKIVVKDILAKIAIEEPAEEVRLKKEVAGI